MATLYKDIQDFLRQERDLFGEFLVTGPRTARGIPPRPASPEPPPPGMDTLFDLPAPQQAPLTTEPWGGATTLTELDAAIHDCLKCPLGQTRTRFVFGVGDPHATLMLIGEAPGADEDLQGEPFVGRAGQLLTKILEAIHFSRDQVYICNILKCRPPGNRKPQPGEVEHCLPYLRKQIQLVRPKLIVCLGLTAAETLLETTQSLTALRGKVLRFDEIPLMVTYHPAALLRNPNWKRPTWEDVQAVRALHDRLVAGDPGA